MVFAESTGLKLSSTYVFRPFRHVLCSLRWLGKDTFSRGPHGMVKKQAIKIVLRDGCGGGGMASSRKRKRSAAAAASVATISIYLLLLCVHTNSMLWNNSRFGDSLRAEMEAHPSGRHNTNEHQLHLVFSTSCGPKQDWQSHLLFYSALRVKQPGIITRIASGCNEEEVAALRKLHGEVIAGLSERFKLHVTSGDWRGDTEFHTTKYWNKPFGVKHWMEEVLGYTHNVTKDGEYMFRENPLHDSDIVILTDPDMILQRPIANDFSKDTAPKFWHPEVKDQLHLYYSVTHGRPMAQTYAYGYDWRKAYGKLAYVVGPNSPVHALSNRDALDYYTAGPPYILTARDIYRVTKYWTDFVPKLSELTDDFMMEMHGYSLAAAHLELKHQLARGFMVSNAELSDRREGWSFINDDTMKDVCRSDTLAHKGPYVIHYCQRLGIGEYFFNKYLFPATALTSCDHPLMQIPSSEEVRSTNFSRWGNGEVYGWDDFGDENPELYRYRNAHMICSIFGCMNDAATHYRDNRCGGRNTPNYEKTWIWPRTTST